MRLRSFRGFSIIEVIVASSLFLVVMTIGVGALQVVKRAGDQLKGRSQPRQQLRALLGHLQREVRAATLIFDPHLTLNFRGGFSHTFQGAPSRNPGDPAVHEVLYALSETADTEPSYTVESLFLTPDSENQGFPGAHRVVLATVTGLKGPTPGSPADIPLDTLPPSRTEARTFATASPSDGLRVWRSASGDGLMFEFVIGHKTEGESIATETYQAHLTMRNNR